jgi:hypothetical protein
MRKQKKRETKETDDVYIRERYINAMGTINGSAKALNVSLALFVVEVLWAIYWKVA